MTLSCLRICSGLLYPIGRLGLQVPFAAQGRAEQGHPSSLEPSVLRAQKMYFLLPQGDSPSSDAFLGEDLLSIKVKTQNVPGQTQFWPVSHPVSRISGTVVFRKGEGPVSRAPALQGSLLAPLIKPHRFSHRAEEKDVLRVKRRLSLRVRALLPLDSPWPRRPLRNQQPQIGRASGRERVSSPV